MPVAFRRRVFRVLVALGAIALLAALVVAYVDRNVFEPRGFAGHAAQTLHDDTVRERLATAVTETIVARSPRTVAAAPILTDLTRSLLQSDQAAAVVRRAATETHNALFSATKGSIVIDLANLGVIAIELLRTQRPEIAQQIGAERGALVLKLADRTLTVDLVATADRVRWLALVLPLLALVLFAAALLLAPARRRAALDAGIAIAATGLVGLTAFVVVRAVVLASSPGGDRDIAAAVFDAFLGGFPWWCLAVVLAGVILAASAVSVVRELDPADVPAAAWARIRREPQSAWGKVAGALALILAGVLVIRDPGGALQLAAALLGAWMVFAGVVTLMRLLVGPPVADSELPTPRELGRRLIPPLVASILVVALVGTAIGLVLDGRSGAEPAVASGPGCNGAVALCDAKGRGGR